MVTIETRANKEVDNMIENVKKSLMRRITVAIVLALASPFFISSQGLSGWQDVFKWKPKSDTAVINKTHVNKPEKCTISKKNKCTSGEKTVSAGLTLWDCYKCALKQSELIAINVELIKETEAHFLQALSIMLPHASFLSTDTEQQEPPKPVSSSSSSVSIIRSNSSERKIRVTQTLFNGFKAFAAIAGSGYERKWRVKDKERAEQLLFVDVANAFYLLIQERKDVEVLQKSKAALFSRIKELRDREKLGRSRPSEVVNAKTQLYAVEAQMELTKSQEMLARQLLEFLVGMPVGEINDTHEIPYPLKPEDSYVSKAMLRPDVESAKNAWKLAREGVQVAGSDFLPLVQIETNYYAQRTGTSKGIDWDVMLTVDVPIFEGTQILGNVKAAESQARQNELLYKRAMRSAPKDIRDAYVKLGSALAVHDALRKAYTFAKLNYYLQRKDYRLNLVNNLDVLASIKSLQDAQLDDIGALYEAKRLYWQLLVACGEQMTEMIYDTF